MKLYKYRSLANFGQIADIILNNRFFAAHFEDLNDPMEGLFYAKRGVNLELVRKVEYLKKQRRIVSFSTDPTNVLLWAHYADSFRGICIEIEVDEGLATKVEYRRLPDLVDNTHSGQEEELATRALSNKLDAWEYESEYRIISSKSWLDEGFRITGILIGQRTATQYRQILDLLATDRIPLFETQLVQVEHRGLVVRITSSMEK